MNVADCEAEIRLGFIRKVYSIVGHQSSSHAKQLTMSASMPDLGDDCDLRHSVTPRAIRLPAIQRVANVDPHDRILRVAVLCLDETSLASRQHHPIGSFHSLRGLACGNGCGLL